MLLYKGAVEFLRHKFYYTLNETEIPGNPFVMIGSIQLVLPSRVCLLDYKG